MDSEILIGGRGAGSYMEETRAGSKKYGIRIRERGLKRAHRTRQGRSGISAIYAKSYGDVRKLTINPPRDIRPHFWDLIAEEGCASAAILFHRHMDPGRTIHMASLAAIRIRK